MSPPILTQNVKKCKILYLFQGSVFWWIWTSLECTRNHFAFDMMIEYHNSNNPTKLFWFYGLHFLIVSVFFREYRKHRLRFVLCSNFICNTFLRLWLCLIGLLEYTHKVKMNFRAHFPKFLFRITCDYNNHTLFNFHLTILLLLKVLKKF